jgi:hypothetical protein
MIADITKLIENVILNEHIDALLKYFEDKPLNFNNPIIRSQFANYISNENVYNYLIDNMGIIADLDEVSDVSDTAENIFNNLDPNMQEEFHDLYVNMDSVDDIMEPSYKFISVIDELPENTLLVRFVGDNQFNMVKRYGFKVGLDDEDKLHATKYYDRSFKENGGYIFAYIADSPEAKKQAKANTIGESYGDNCIFFKHSGLLIDHKLDKERQVITYGLDIDKNECIFAEGLDDNNYIITNGIFNNDPKSYVELVKSIKAVI